MSTTPLPSRLSPREVQRRARPKVLVVARDPFERDSIDNALDAAGLEVLSVGDALGAYWALRGYAAAVIVLDSQLPREDRDELRNVVSRDPRMSGVSMITLDPRPLDSEEIVARVLGALIRG